MGNGQAVREIVFGHPTELPNEVMFDRDDLSISFWESW